MLLGISPNSSMSFYIIVPSVKFLLEVPGNLENSSGLHQFDLTQLHIRLDELKLAWSTCTVLITGCCLVHI